MHLLIAITTAGTLGVRSYACVIGHTGIAICFVIAAAHGVILHCANAVRVYLFRINADYLSSFGARAGEDAAQQQGKESHGYIFHSFALEDLCVIRCRFTYCAYIN